MAEAHTDYIFKPLGAGELLRKLGQSITSWPTGSEATLSVYIAERDALKEKNITPEMTTIYEYQDKLAEQARDPAVPTQRTILDLLHPDDSEAENETTFIHWDHQAHRLLIINDFALVPQRPTFVWSAKCDMISLN